MPDSDKFRDIFLGARGVSALRDLYDRELGVVLEQLKKLTPVDGKAFGVVVANDSPDSKSISVQAGFGVPDDTSELLSFFMTIDKDSVLFRSTQGYKWLTKEEVFTDYSALRRRIGHWVATQAPERVPEVMELFNIPDETPAATKRSLPAAKPIRFGGN